MKVFQVIPNKNLISKPSIEKDISSILTMLEESNPGEFITIKIIEMSEDAYHILSNSYTEKHITGNCNCGSKKYGKNHKPYDHKGWTPK